MFTAPLQQQARQAARPTPTPQSPSWTTNLTALFLWSPPWAASLPPLQLPPLERNRSAVHPQPPHQCDACPLHACTALWQALPLTGPRCHCLTWLRAFGGLSGHSRSSNSRLKGARIMPDLPEDVSDTVACTLSGCSGKLCPSVWSSKRCLPSLHAIAALWPTVTVVILAAQLLSACDSSAAL